MENNKHKNTYLNLQRKIKETSPLKNKNTLRTLRYFETISNEEIKNKTKKNDLTCANIFAVEK